MQREPVGLALVGLGRMGMFHAEALREIADVEVRALVDVRSSALAAGAKVYPEAQTVASLESLPGDSGVEALLIASSTPTHVPVTEVGLSRGWHVLCEKPLSLDPDESDRLGLTAARLGLVLQVGFWRRFAPPWRLAKEAIDEGRVGTPVMLRLSQWDAEPPPADFCDPAVSGGLAVDCGVHEFDLAEWLSGSEIVSVAAQPLPLVEESIGRVGDVDNLLITARLAGGAVAVIDLSRNGRYGDDVRTEVLGSDGAVFVDLLPESLTRVGSAAGMEPLPGSVVPDAMAAGVAAQAVTFARAVRGEKVGYPDAAASSRAVRLAQQAMAGRRS